MKKAYCLLPFLFFLLVYSPNYNVQALEFENVDSMDVHPENRWTIVNDEADIESVAVSDGLLNISDVGDNSDDYYIIKRDLRSFDDSINIRFRLGSNGSTQNWHNRLRIEVNDDTDDQHAVMLILKEISTGSGLETELFYYNTDGGYESKNLAGDEDLDINIWYKLRLDYDTQRSIFRWRMYFDNDSEIFDYVWQDVGESIPGIFEKTSLNIMFTFQAYTSGQETSVEIDYVEAPFKEYEWTKTRDDVSSNWLSDDTWEHAKAQDNIDRYQIWDLVVPKLDLVAATLRLEVDDIGDSSGTDNFDISFQVFCVDADDGDLHSLYLMELQFHSGQYRYAIYVDSVIRLQETGSTGTNELWGSFVVGTKDDRTIFPTFTRVGWNTSDVDDVEELHYDTTVSEVASDPSQEFLLRVIYDMDFDGDMVVDAWIEDFDLISRESFREMNIGDAIDAQPDWYYEEATGWNPFAGIEQAISDLLEGMAKVLGDVWSGIIQPILDLLIDIVTDIMDALVDIASDLLDAILTALKLAVDALADVFFAIWNAAGFPNLLDILDKFLSNAVTTIAKIPQGIDDVLTYIDYWRALLSIFIVGIIFGYPALRAKGDIGEWLAGIIDTCTINILPISILGVSVHVPLGILLIVPLFDLGWSA